MATKKTTEKVSTKDTSTVCPNCENSGLRCSLCGCNGDGTFKEESTDQVQLAVE